MARSTVLSRKKKQLEPRLRALPASPGIYRFYDVDGGLIYIGKSVCLRDRVRSYFNGQAPSKKIRRLRQEIADLDWQETGSELEALLLESRLIKRHQPRFNVMLKEFVPLPYLRVDFDDPFPRLEVTRAPRRDGAAYFGPFRSQATLEEAVGTLTDALKLRDCTVPGDALPRQRPCYRYELGTCSGPCLGAVDQEEYGRSIQAVRDVFEGREKRVIESLGSRMERAAERLQFELAARLRNAIRHIQAISGRQHALVSAVQDLSLIAACPSLEAARLSLFAFRAGRMVFQADVLLTELQFSGSRQDWAERLLTAGYAAVETGEDTIDAELLDEIQIVSAWMRKNTQTGAYWQMPADPTSADALDSLCMWLTVQAASDTRAAA